MIIVSNPAAPKAPIRPAELGFCCTAGLVLDAGGGAAVMVHDGSTVLETSKTVSNKA